MKVIEKIYDESSDSAQAGHHKAPRIWVMVADRHVARIFKKKESHLEIVGKSVPSKVEHERVLTNKTVGRVGSSGGGSAHHKIEPHAGAGGRKEELLFIDEIVKWLDEAVGADAFDRLVLIASPKMLGDLRHALSHPVQLRIVAEISKDLTKANEKELWKELESVVWF